MDLDDYINFLRWYRKWRGVQLATRMRAGATVEDGKLRAILKNRQVEVR